MRILVLVGLIVLAPAVDGCEASLKLSGVIEVPNCPYGQTGCVSAGQQLYKYAEASPDDPTSLSIAVQSSPWRLYDADMRIMSVEDVALLVRSHPDPKINRVELVGSWTGVAPSGVPSLASRLSKALDGFPVKGQNGFLWMDKHGATRTTHQAFSVRQGGGLYGVHDGDEVMVSLVEGWAAGMEDRIPANDGEFMLKAGVGQDVFLLCPEHALADFEAAAKMGNAVAAYNAAFIRLERNQAGDRVAAEQLLARAAALGDAKSTERLAGLRHVPPAPKR